MNTSPREVGAWYELTLESPLWYFEPRHRLTVLSSRRRHGILQDDPEPTGDAEYS